MQNIEITTTKEGKIQILIDPKVNLGDSKSGKTIMVATTNGNITIPGHPEIKLGLNAYQKK